MKAECHQFQVLGDLGANPLCSSHNNGRLDVWTGSLQGDAGDLVLPLAGDKGSQCVCGEVPTSSFQLLGGSQSAPVCRLIGIHNLRQQLGKTAVKSLPGINWEMGIFV